MSDYATLCETAARAGGERLASWLGRFAIREKGPADLVTDADCASQDAIREILLGAEPDFGFIAEESSPHKADADYVWVVDPLDGTTNYVHQFPHYCVSVALVERGQPLAAVVYDPVSDECFRATRGKGATLNGQEMRVSRERELSQALIGSSFSERVRRDSPDIAQFISALLVCRAVRRTGSSALNLAYVAAGRLDGFWGLNTKYWDIAAGILLIREAGGIVSGQAGAKLTSAAPHPVAAATPELHRQFLELLEAAAQA